MSKKADNAERKFIDRLIKADYKEQEDVKNQVSMFYEAVERAEISTKLAKDPFAGILLTIRKKPLPQPLTKQQMLEKCSHIRDNVKQGKPDNIELNFIQGIQKFRSNKHELDNTVIKAIAKDANTPVYLHIKKGDSLNSLVFIGGDDALAFLVTKGLDGEDCVVRLSEFHLLSISKNSTSEKEIGLMTSYSWMGAKVHSSVIIGMNLDPIKNLLLSEGLRTMTSEEKNPAETLKEDANE